MSLSDPALALWISSGLEILGGLCVAFGWGQEGCFCWSGAGVPPIGQHGIVNTLRAAQAGGCPPVCAA